MLIYLWEAKIAIVNHLVFIMRLYVRTKVAVLHTQKWVFLNKLCTVTNVKNNDPAMSIKQRQKRPSK